MTKVAPAKNNMDMDFLNDFDTTVSQSNTTPKANQTSASVQNVKPAEKQTAAAVNETSEHIFESEIGFSGKENKNCQVVMRTSEKDRDAMRAYFMRHGISVSQGIKIAVKYLEQQEAKGLVHFSEIGLF